jgi:hypothetical protein
MRSGALSATVATPQGHNLTIRNKLILCDEVFENSRKVAAQVFK